VERKAGAKWGANSGANSRAAGETIVASKEGPRKKRKRPGASRAFNS
jgi:hypothetical protein